MKLISAFVFPTLIVQSLFFLNAKFQASSHLLWLYSPVCVGPGRKPQRPVFSQRGSYARFYYRIIVLQKLLLSVCFSVKGLYCHYNMAAFYNHYNTGYGVTAEEQSDHHLHSLQYCLHCLEDNILVRTVY